MLASLLSRATAPPPALMGDVCVFSIGNGTPQPMGSWVGATLVHRGRTAATCQQPRGTARRLGVRPLSQSASPTPTEKVASCL